MKDYKLDPDEQRILEDVESGVYIDDEHSAERIAMLEDAANRPRRGYERITTDLTHEEMGRLERKAMERNMTTRQLAEDLLRKAIS